jgi:drug/metabolite transporter (DMT)-like permease
MERKEVLAFVGIGILVAFHWVTFYGAIKYANASVALAAFALTSLFTSIIEPILTDKAFDKSELLIGILVVPAMLLIANNLDVSMVRGLLVGILSAFLASLFGTLNKKMVNKATSYQITFIEMTSAFLFLSLFVPFITGPDSPLMPTTRDLVYLLILALACTTFAFIITLKAMETVTAFEANLVINLEPVYGILLAALILKDHKEVGMTFYIGTGLILLIVLSYPLTKRRKLRKLATPRV